MLPANLGVVMVPTVWSRLICRIEQRELSVLECQCKIIIIAYYIIQLLKYFLCYSSTWIRKTEEINIIVFSSHNFPRQRELLWSSRTWDILLISSLNCKILWGRDQFLATTVSTEFSIVTITINICSTELTTQFWNLLWYILSSAIGI